MSGHPLAREVARLKGQMADLERRLENSTRQGTCAAVDPEKGLMRLEVGRSKDGTPQLGPWIPYAQMAGAMKAHIPPSVGQSFVQVAAGGDFEQGVALPLSWSNSNPSPSAKGDENVITFGGAKIEVRGDEIAITVPRLVVKCGSTEMLLEEGQMVLKGAIIREN